MKKIPFALLLFALTLQVKAQLVVNLQLPPGGLTLKSQLWNMALVNSSGQAMMVKVDMTFTDVTNNALVLTASSSQFDLAPGTRQMQVTDFGLIAYNAVSSNYNVDNSPNGFLPIGNFNICYRFSKIVHPDSEVLTEECETVAVEPLSPPMLVYPEDEAEIETSRPVFNWIPPAPSNLFANLSYSLRLVEVAGTQTPADAIQQNMAIYAEPNVFQLSTPYPAGLPALDTGKIYAWQITANANGNFIAKSDVWAFRLARTGNNNASSYATSAAFAKLQLDPGADYFLCGGLLKLYYDNYVNDSAVTLSIRDLNNYTTPVFEDTNYLLIPGQNFKQLDISNKQEFSDNHFYQIELINSRKERWIGKFLYKKQD